MDVYGWRMKFGVIAPGPNTSMQPHLDALRPRGVTNHISRLEITNRPMGTPEEFQSMMREVNASIEKAVCLTHRFFDQTFQFLAGNRNAF